MHRALGLDCKESTRNAVSGAGLRLAGKLVLWVIQNLHTTSTTRLKEYVAYNATYSLVGSM